MMFTSLFFAVTLAATVCAETAASATIGHRQRPYNADAVRAKFAELNKKEPINTIYIRNGSVVGDRLGHLNETIAARGGAIAVRSSPSLNRRGELFSLPDGTNINLLEVVGAGALLTAVVCAFVPGCPAFVASNLGFASASEAAVELTTAATAGGGKRDDTEYEKFGCIPQGDFVTACDNDSNEATIQGIADVSDHFYFPSPDHCVVLAWLTKTSARWI
ncbi:hypothetical protein GGR57DRAFT_470095, partial [Xylariaceae sp. FL1272]